jgi:hypothetical protein
MKKKEKNPKIKQFYLIIFFLAVTILSFLSLWRALGFHFWRDDWGNLWELTYHPNVSIFFDSGYTLVRHPGLAVEKVIGNYFFGQNILGWQFFGIALRVFDSLAVALMVYGLTRSKKAGVLAGLFMASTIGGLESVTWISAHTSALLIFFLSVGIYFWAKSLDLPPKHYGVFILALFFISCAPLVTPAAGLIILPMIILWDFLSWLRVRNKQFFWRIVLRIGIASITVLGVVGLFNSILKIFSGSDILNNFKSALLNISLMKNYFSSLGNLLTSWFYPISEPISLSNSTAFNQRSALFFVFVVLLIVIFFLKKKSRNLQVAVFFSVWMFLFYLPNWMYEKTLIVGSSHRYLADATVALVSLVAVFIYKLKPKLVVLFSIIFIALNVIASNKFLKSMSAYRSFKIIEPIWSQINKQVAVGQKDMIFMYQGTDLVWGTSMNWSGPVPFGIKRGISNANDLPIVSGDRQLIVKLLCEKNVYRPSLGGWAIQKERIPISHLYAWMWDGKVLTNISESERKSFIKEAPCKVLP